MKDMIQKSKKRKFDDFDSSDSEIDESQVKPTTKKLQLGKSKVVARAKPKRSSKFM